MSDCCLDVSASSDLKVGRRLEPWAISHLKSCRRFTAEHNERLFRAFAQALEAKLLEFVDKAKSNEEARQLLETSASLRRNRDRLTQKFTQFLDDGFVEFAEGRLDTASSEDKYRGDMLSLVDHEDLEETIAQSSIANRVEDELSEQLWLLKQRFAVLNEGRKVHDRNNPVSPLQFCEALRRILSGSGMSTKAKIIAYKVFDPELSRALGRVVKDINEYLAENGILSHLCYPPSGNAPQASDHPEADESLMASSQVASPSESEKEEEAKHQPGLFQAIRSLQHRIARRTSAGAPILGISEGSLGHPAATGGPAGKQLAVYSTEQLISALQALQIQALSMSGSAAEAPVSDINAVAVSQGGRMGQQLAAQLKEQSENGEVDPEDMQIIDLVGMLFEFMLSDEQLPDPVKAVLSYLHTPFLKIAFIDPAFFEKPEHPARLLLNKLAEAGVRWVSNDGSSHYDMYSMIRETVSRVLEGFENDVRIFAELLLEFSAHVRKVARRQELMEKRATEKVQGEETLREAKIRVNQEIRSRIDGKDLPSAVLLLLLQPWSDYLAFLLLRYGEQSESWNSALRAVDGVLWSIMPKQDTEDKAQRMELLDELLETIESGFDTIGYDRAKGKKLIEALTSLQRIALQRKKAAPALAPVRSKLESEAAKRAGANLEAGQKISPEERKIVEKLRLIEFGTWFEFEGGKRLKVAWYNSRTMQYMLVDQLGKKVAMKSGLELARGILAGTAKVIAGSTKPFFERALETILQNLNAKAEADELEATNG